MFFTPEDQAAGVPEQELETARGVGRFAGVGWRVRRDGSRFWAEEIATAVYDEQGTVRGFSKIARDITERMLAESERERLLRQAMEANRVRDDFLATASHELRTPLNAMLGWTQLLQRGRMSPDAERRALDTVARNARTQAKLIEDLLDMSRIISGTLRLDVKPTSIASATAGALEALRPLALERGIELHSDVDLGRSGFVQADAARLEQVIWNLVSNAVKFTPSGGQVVVSTRSLEEAMEISVTDTGIGISPEFLPFVFDRFRQADSSVTRSASGSASVSQSSSSWSSFTAAPWGSRVRALARGRRSGFCFPIAQLTWAGDSPAPAKTGPSGRSRPGACGRAGPGG